MDGSPGSIGSWLPASREIEKRSIQGCIPVRYRRYSRARNPPGSIDVSMTLFEFLSIGVSLVLGLGVTLLLTSLLAAFRARRRVRLDWIPFVWAAYVLAIQGQYWWVTWGTPYAH